MTILQNPLTGWRYSEWSMIIFH